MEKKTKSQGSNATTCQSLLMTGEHQERWLSRPDSRLVLNPFNYDVEPMGGLTQVAYCDRPSLPLNVGYLDPWVKNARGPELNNAVMVLERWEGGGFSEAREYETTWQPHTLGFAARYPGGLCVEGFDYLYDHRTVARRLAWRGEELPVIAGEYTGQATVNGSFINVTSKNYSYSISVSRHVGAPVFYASREDLLAGEHPLAEPPDGRGFFALELMPELQDGEFTIALVLDTYLVNPADIELAAAKASSDPAQEVRVREAETFWDEYLKKVPPIENFEFESVDAKGVAMRDVRQMYHVGWVLLYASLAPANPELGFPYRQMTAGKSCLWGYGEPRCAYTAAWDSLYAIQLCAFVDAEAAWDTLTGIMSLVDSDGMLAGESLPVMRARTAWILYRQKKDMEALRQNFANIERNMLWSMEHPYWIWMENNPLDSTLKDSDFTASILVDIPYLVKICEALGELEKAESWHRKFDDYMNEFIAWTFPGDGSLPTENYTAARENDDGSGERSPGNALWVTKGLYIHGLPKQYVERLMELFFSVYDPSKPFCGFPFVKVEEIEYTIYGLIDNGYEREASVMIEASVRDVTRSRFSGENYTEDEPPVCWGVRPSLFGVVQLSDGIWMRNGYRYDSGVLNAYGAFDKESDSR